MDRKTLSHYGWLIITTLVLSVILALASPLGVYVGDGIISIGQQFTATEENNVNQDNVDKLSNQFTGEFNDCDHINIDFVGYKEVTCDVDGYTGDEICRKCKAVVKQGEVIKAKGHEYAHEILVDGTNHKQICNICENVKLTPHTIEKEVVEPSTCIKQGLQHVWCDICGYDDIIPEPLWPNSHSGKVVYVGQEFIHQKWDCCNVTYSSAHTYTGATLINATCENKGTTRYTCACGYYYDSVNIAALGHNYQQQTTPTTPYQYSAATCKAKAVYYKKCTRCASRNNQTYEYGDVAPHNYTVQDKTSTYLKSTATCQTPTTYYYKCQWCESKGTPTYTVGNKSSHNYTVKDSTSTYLKSAATCTAAAVYYYKCQWCTNKGTDSNTYTNGSALGHGNYTYSGAVAATCTADGKNNDTFCGRCGVKTAIGSTIGKLGHNDSANSSTLRTAATCTAAATYYKQCSRCGAQQTTFYTSGNALGHNYSHTTYGATCTSQGYTNHTCTRCGSAYNDGWTGALGHSLTTTYSGNCGSSSTRTTYCTRCGYVSESVASVYTSHSYGSVYCTQKHSGSTSCSIHRGYYAHKVCQNGNCQVNKTTSPKWYCWGCYGYGGSGNGHPTGWKRGNC